MLNVQCSTFKLESGCPRVAGTITRHRTLEKAKDHAPFACDLIEVRLDRVGSALPGWLACCEGIERQGLPVLLTLRLKVEGGQWDLPDPERMPFLSDAIRVLSMIDVEYRSTLAAPLCSKAEKLGKTVVVSCHDFEGTPPLKELQDIVDGIRELPTAVPKIVTMVNSAGDVDTLAALLAANRQQPICVLGMGDAGRETRTAFPAMGSCLSYGFIDASSAPGQLTAGELVEALTATVPAYAAYRSIFERSTLNVQR